MQLKRLSNYHKGWLIGDFQPTVLSTKNFEFAVKYYQTGDKEPSHFHKKATEYTVIVSGRFTANETELEAGDIMVVEPNEAIEFTCLQSGATAVIKTPSVKEDKYLEKQNSKERSQKKGRSGKKKK